MTHHKDMSAPYSSTSAPHGLKLDGQSVALEQSPRADDSLLPRSRRYRVGAVTMKPSCGPAVLAGLAASPSRPRRAREVGGGNRRSSRGRRVRVRPERGTRRRRGRACRRTVRGGNRNARTGWRCRVGPGRQSPHRAAERERPSADFSARVPQAEHGLPSGMREVPKRLSQPVLTGSLRRHRRIDT